MQRPSTGISGTLRPVAGPAGNPFPRLLVDLVRVFLDRKVFAAPRAAEGDGPSADPEFDFLAADLAVHKTS
jgi:hypothetical protein